MSCPITYRGFRALSLTQVELRRVGLYGLTMTLLRRRFLTAFLVILCGARLPAFASDGTFPLSDPIKAAQLENIVIRQINASYGHLPQFNFTPEFSKPDPRNGARPNIQIKNALMRGRAYDRARGAGMTYAAIYDPKTGELLQTCQAPCRLSTFPSEPVLLIRYNRAHRWTADFMTAGQWRRRLRKNPNSLRLIPLIAHDQIGLLRCNKKCWRRKKLMAMPSPACA